MFRKKKRPPTAVFICADGGAVIPAGSRVCPECGADGGTGRSTEPYSDDGWPDEEIDEAVVRRKENAKKILAIGSSLVGALALAAFLAVEIPPYGIYVGGAVFATVVVSLVVFRERLPSLKKLEKSLKRELLVLTGRDPTLVERLVTYERSRRPDALRAELLERAIDRLTRDRGR